MSVAADRTEMFKALADQCTASVKAGEFDVAKWMTGVETCFAGQGLRQQVASKHIQQILVLRLDEIGDVVLSSPFLRELRKNYPQARITLVVKPECENLVALCPYVNQIYSFNVQGHKRNADREGVLKSILEFARDYLWEHSFELCLVPRFDHDVYFAGVLASLSGASERVGFSEQATPWKQRSNKGFDHFYTRIVPPHGTTHEVERNLSVIRFLGGKVQSSALEAWTGAEDERFAEQALSAFGKRLAILSPGSPTSNRYWPIERYVECARSLVQEYQCGAVILGAASDMPAGKALKSALGDNLLDLCGRTTLRQAAAICKRAQIYIGRDTGLMHVAAAAGCRVVEISPHPQNASPIHFNSPVRFGPWGTPSVILQPLLPAAPCRHYCAANEAHCILGVSVEQVLAGVRQMMNPAVIPQQEAPPVTVQEHRRDTWTAAMRRFETDQAERKKQDPAAALVAADEFFLEHLKKIRPEQAMTILPALTESWLNHRRLPHRFGAVPAAELLRLQAISNQLTAQLIPMLNGDLSLFGRWSERQQLQWVSIWRLFFLSPFSPRALGGKIEKMDAVTDSTPMKLRECLLQSLFVPSAAEEMKLDVASVFSESAPSFLKAIVGSWFVSTAYFGVLESDRRRVCLFASGICKALMQQDEWLSFGTFAVLVEEMMASFWRVSYAGGDSKRELSILGDAVSFRMNRFIPQPPLEIRKKDITKEPLRIGYVSRNFCKQAVSFYMVNRLIHHDRKQFEVHTFAVGDRDDELTSVFRENSERFERHSQLTDFAGMIRKLRDSRLDILVFADLGMDPFTLMLAGLRLAPVQCVLVGHGVTSGMPNVDYYISGDFEPDDAQRYYREKLVRLPNLGAAQYPPFEPEKYPVRKDYKIPDDAVVYVSCANGIKIHPDQDRQFLEILRQVPNAWLILKPFQTPDAVDPRFMERIFAPARAAGVAHRILIVPPFRQARDVLGLLKIADIQLDTYPYGGWTTNMEAVHMGLPIVTRQGEMARSRWGAAMLRAIGTDFGIARTEREYVEQAVRLGLDAKLRGQVRNQIKEKAAALFFNGAAAQPPYEEMLLRCYNEKIGAMHK